MNVEEWSREDAGRLGWNMSNPGMLTRPYCEQSQWGKRNTYRNRPVSLASDRGHQDGSEERAGQNDGVGLGMSAIIKVITQCAP